MQWASIFKAPSTHYTVLPTQRLRSFEKKIHPLFKITFTQELPIFQNELFSNFLEGRHISHEV